MWLIIIDLLYLVAYFWLVKRLFKLTPTQIGYYQQKYLTFSVLYLGQWFIVGFLLIGLNVLKFFPQFRQEFSFPLGILGMLMSIPVRIKAWRVEKKVAKRKIKSPKDVEAVLEPFCKIYPLYRYEEYANPPKTSIEALHNTLLFMGALFSGPVLLKLLPFSIAINILAVVIFILVVFIVYRLEYLHIYSWLVEEKIIKSSDLMPKQRYVWYFFHERKRGL
ncbi:hypothetical protein [Lactobacillus sp. HT06-2]|uniref:hypothetical protein n=1 Tax=Lactobacillus sp. HT06-2 TaxID=2080222 RepID=UPI0011AFA651|nr:hypothetical protein [Lactobacillus sp. HT06-2]